MRKLSTKPAAQQSGFTLIELVIVIVIIGILAAVAIPNFATVSSEAKLAKCTAILGAVKSSYAVALAVGQGAKPSAGALFAQMSDPTCTAGGVCDIATITYGANMNSSDISLTSCTST